MAKNLNEDQRSFLDSIDRAFEELDRSNAAALKFLLGFVVFILCITFVYWFWNNWFFIRGRFLLWRAQYKNKDRHIHRTRRRVDVTIQPDGASIGQERSATIDLSPTGMFIRLGRPLEKGSQLKVFLHTDDDKPIECWAEIVWVQKQWSEHHPIGAGCRFIDLSKPDRQRLQRLCKKTK